MEKPNEQRTILELLKILRKFLIRFDTPGLCRLIDNLYYTGTISLFEQNNLQQYLNKNKPSRENRLLHHNGLWFPKWDKNLRLDWIDQQIKKEQEKEASYIIMTSSICDVEVSYEIVNGKRTKQIIETGTTYQEKKL